jgi:cytidyltransferase-like protein
VKIGLCLGCYDVLHHGHVRHLQAARALCDWLVVSITPDDCVNKPGRPVFTATDRAKVIGAMRCVDEVTIGQGPDPALRALDSIRPQRYFKGQEYERNNHPGFLQEKRFCEANGIEVVFTREPTFSSTETLRRLGV